MKVMLYRNFCLKSLEWHKEQNIDTILEWIPPATYPIEYNYEIVGEDLEGRPITVVPFGVWDVRKVINSGERNSWLRYTDQMFANQFEKMKENSIKYEREVTQFVFIVDMANFPMRQLTSISS